jgi:hypothetical protein
LSFRRTSKVPSNGHMFYTPDLGHFPLYSVNKFRGLPSSVRKLAAGLLPYTVRKLTWECLR